MFGIFMNSKFSDLRSKHNIGHNISTCTEIAMKIGLVTFAVSTGFGNKDRL